jgi:bifunctional UDP-N-acetylglucosamine pyrophosphorylase / glucosamine-1-phosphate N-acetyltransferase
LSKINQLLKKGVHIPNPHSVDIGQEVDLKRISADSVAIYSGCKIYGRDTLILKGAKLGYEAPVTIENCYIGPKVELKGGYFKDAVFLKDAHMGSNAHVREGTILEEHANGAHTVGLKQTILLPYVTLGSLINFCDCLMAGGTSPKDHSEVGSSYIHFNYTPHQDKATASLMGDVPSGVMLDQPPIFLGGQGGLVGPTRLAFGTIIAAGSIYRKDELRPGLLLFEGGGKGGKMSFSAGLYRSLKRTIYNNLIYIGNLMALRQWYSQIRSQFISADFPKSLLIGLQRTLDKAIDERIKRLKGLREKMPRSMALYRNELDAETPSPLLSQKEELYTKWPEIESGFNELKNIAGDIEQRDYFIEVIDSIIKENGQDYITTIKALDKKAKETGTKWLTSIVTTTVAKIANYLPSYGMLP